MAICEIDGCDKQLLAKGLCPMHYQRLRTKGDVGSATSARAAFNVFGSESERKAQLYRDRKSGARPLKTPESKTCSRCRVEKPAASFRESFLNDSGLDSRCHDCVGHDNRLRLFGLSEADYVAMLASQGGGCAICGGQETAMGNGGRAIRALAVDHDHATGEVRGLLCQNCNKSLGCMQDDPARLMAAAEYLLKRVDVLGLVA